jgi:IPT/TIG domain./Cohesin domain.
VSGLTPSEGDEAGGTTVTITGNNFIVGTAATVMFGENAATEVNVVSATEITCKSPAGTGSVDVSVAQDGKTSNTAQFTYTSQNTSMTLTPGNITGAPGDELTIPITISDLAAAFDSTAFGFTLQVDSNVLEYASIDKSGTMSETFTMVNAAENEAGKIKVSGALFGGVPQLIMVYW